MKTFALVCIALGCTGAPLVVQAGSDDGQKSREALVDVAKACPGVRIDLRYATSDNATQRPIYPGGARCMLRASVAQRLRRAQAWLRPYGVSIKVWDAYRPAWAQRVLWQVAPKHDFVADPARGGSLHTWGVAVDVTLVARLGSELKMPSGFDDFSSAATRNYSGTDPIIARNLRLLQSAMSSAGFMVMRDEWWHFVANDYRDFAPIEMPLTP